MKTAAEKLKDSKEFLKNAKQATKQLEKFTELIEKDPKFQQLWEKDSAAALRQVGINPDARMEMGKPPYSKGPECNWCYTPLGNLCHC